MPAKLHDQHVISMIITSLLYLTTIFHKFYMYKETNQNVKRNEKDIFILLLRKPQNNLVSNQTLNICCKNIYNRFIVLLNKFCLFTRYHDEIEVFLKELNNVFFSHTIKVKSTYLFMIWMEMINARTPTNCKFTPISLN